MSTENTTAAGQPAAQTNTSAQTATTSTAANTAAPDPEEFKAMTREQFNARLAEAESAGVKRLLKALGVEKPEDLKAALAKLKEIENANLTASERMKKQLEELIPKAARADELLSIVETHAKLEFERLPTPLQKSSKR